MQYLMKIMGKKTKMSFTSLNDAKNAPIKWAARTMIPTKVRAPRKALLSMRNIGVNSKI